MAFKRNEEPTLLVLEHKTREEDVEYDIEYDFEEDDDIAFQLENTN